MNADLLALSSQPLSEGLTFNVGHNRNEDIVQMSTVDGSNQQIRR
jgi:hypothetical protein